MGPFYDDSAADRKVKQKLIYMKIVLCWRSVISSALWKALPPRKEIFVKSSWKKLPGTKSRGIWEAAAVQEKSILLISKTRRCVLAERGCYTERSATAINVARMNAKYASDSNCAQLCIQYKCWKVFVTERSSGTLTVEANNQRKEKAQNPTAEWKPKLNFRFVDSLSGGLLLCHTEPSKAVYCVARPWVVD